MAETKRDDFDLIERHVAHLAGDCEDGCSMPDDPAEEEQVILAALARIRDGWRETVDVIAPRIGLELHQQRERIATLEAERDALRKALEGAGK